MAASQIETEAETSGEPPADRTARMARWLGLIGWGAMLVAYTVLFSTIGFSDPLNAVQRAVFNTVPAALLSWPFARLIERQLIDRSLVWQVSGHFWLSIAYAFLWYVGLQVGYGLQNGLPEGGIVGRPLSGAALSWQMFQGVTLYAAIAMFTYAVFYRSQRDALVAERDRRVDVADNSSGIQQIFVKDGKGLRPVLLSDVFCLSGAGDYSEIVTRNGTFLSTSPLSQFESELPSERFLRVHRSHIVGLNAILSVESGGNGRLTLHLPKGHSITTSRAGASRLKERAL